MYKLVLAVLGLMLFLLAAVAPDGMLGPWRLRIVAGGLFAWEASTVL